MRIGLLIICASALLASGLEAQALNNKSAPVVNRAEGIETQVVLRAESGQLPAGLESTVRQALAKVALEYDQPAGGRTIIRLSGVWQPLAGQWRLFFRVVADHMIYAENRWIRLGDSQTVNVVEIPQNFAGTLAQGLQLAVSIAIEGQP